MELDELKAAWRALDRRLERQNAIDWTLFLERRLDRLHSRLRPLFWGQIVQMLFGIVLASTAIGFWTRHREVPHLLVAGAIVHAYAVLTIACGGITLGLMSRIDYAAPVLAIQKRLGELRRFHVYSGLLIGLAWWLLWIPLTMMAFSALFGADLYAHIPGVIQLNIAAGLLGLIATCWLLHWSRQPHRPRLTRFVDDGMTGRSLRNAQATLAEITRFEQD